MCLKTRNYITEGCKQEELDQIFKIQECPVIMWAALSVVPAQIREVDGSTGRSQGLVEGLW